MNKQPCFSLFIDYYPFGLKHKGYNNVTSSNGNSTAQKKGFANEELEEELGKNTVAFQWRDYDPAIGRFNKIDRFAEKYYNLSAYSYAGNNPIYFIDVKGDSIHVDSKEDFNALKTNVGNKKTSLTAERDAITRAATNRKGKVKYSKEQKAQVAELNTCIGELNTVESDLTAMENSSEFTFKLNEVEGNIADLSVSAVDVNSGTYTLNYLKGDIGNQVHEVAKHGCQIANGDLTYSVNGAGNVMVSFGAGLNNINLEVSAYQAQYSYMGALTGYRTPISGSREAQMNTLGGNTGSANQLNQRFSISAHSQITPSLVRSMTEKATGNIKIY